MNVVDASMDWLCIVGWWLVDVLHGESKNPEIVDDFFFQKNAPKRDNEERIGLCTANILEVGHEERPK